MFARLSPLLLTLSIAFGSPGSLSAKPNVVIIFCDDLGYGDLSCFGHPTIRTPHLDRLAMEGQKWTQFYVAASVCTPSRAGLLTGRLPIRTGMCSDRRRVLFPDSAKGLPSSEITLAEGLKEAGYATAAVGKWHLGHLPEFLPTRQGFDTYFGVPYSNDMDRVPDKGPGGRRALMEPRNDYWNIPLMRDEEIIERPPQQAFLTKRYTEEAVAFIERQAKKPEQPFFLYLAHSMPHVPLFASGAFRGHSIAGLYGDIIEEIDWSVGQVVQTLKASGLDDDTILVFTSDNGPWLPFKTHGGSAGPLREGKGSTWEGGMREPTIVWGPGRIQPGIVHELGCTLDLMPTFLDLAGVPLPDDRVYDGQSLAGTWLRNDESPRQTVYYYHGEQLFAVRHGAYKLHFTTKTEYTGQQAVRHDPPLLFHLEEDLGERYDIAAGNPDIVEEITQLAAQHRQSFDPPANHLDERLAPDGE